MRAAAIRAIGAAGRETGGAAGTAEGVSAEGQAAIDALGPDAGEPGCTELAVWAGLLAASVGLAARTGVPTIPSGLVVETPTAPAMDRARS